MSCNHEHCHEEEKENSKLNIVLYFISIIIFGIAFIPALEPYRLWIYLVSVALSGYDLIIEGIKNIFHFNFEEDTLMTIAVVGAFLLGEYPESCLVVLLFKLGEFLEDFAIERSNKNIEDISKIKSNTANLIKNNVVNVVKVEEIQVGDVILIKPGEKVPVDCKISSGNSELDTSPVTGESRPVLVESGREILSGSINLTGAIYCEVLKCYKDSTASQIIDLVHEATHNKGKAEKFMTKFSKIYTPIIIVSAILLVVIPWIMGLNLMDWIQTALFFLVASCPCSLVISIPLSFFSCIGAISKKGMVIKGTKHIEDLSKANAIAFDKTGTITTGKMILDQIKSWDEFEEDKMIQYIYSLEKLSNHPISTAIQGISQQIQELEVREYKEIAGHGIVGKIEENEVLFGNKELLEKYQVNTDKYEEGSIAFCVNGNLTGYITLKEEVRKEANDMITELKKIGIKDIFMLTGDSKISAERIAENVGIKKVKSGLLPQDKLQEIRKLQKEGSKVIFVGDGINDSPVIAAADFGISMGTGAEIANNTADSILMSNNIGSIPSIIKVAKKSMRIVKANIVFSLLAKVVVLALGFMHIAPIWLAVFADTGVTMLTVLNSLRIFRDRK